MAGTLLLKLALAAVEQVLRNKSLSLEKTKEELETLQVDIEEKIEGIEQDIEHQD